MFIVIKHIPEEGIVEPFALVYPDRVAACLAIVSDIVDDMQMDEEDDPTPEVVTKDIKWDRDRATWSDTETSYTLHEVALSTAPMK